MNILYSKWFLRSLLCLLALLMVLGSAWLLTNALRDAYRLASDAALEQAAKAYSNSYQIIKTYKAKPIGLNKTLDEMVKDIVYEIQSTIKDSSLLGYKVYIFNSEGRVIASINKEVRGGLEKGVSTEVDKSIVKIEALIKDKIPNLSNFLANQNLTKLIETSFEEGEGPTGFFDNLLTPQSRYIFMPVFNQNKSTNSGIAITRTKQLLNASSTIIRLKIQENLLYLAGYSLAGILLFALLLGALNRLIRSKIELDHTTEIVTGWRQFSHDVDTPLDIITRHAKDIYDAGQGGESPLIILNEVDNIEEALNQQRVFARGGNDVGFVEEVDVKALILEIITNITIEDKLKRAKIRLTHDLNDGCIVKINKTSVMRAIINLLNNAIDFSPKGAIQIIVTKQNKWLVITILDTGTGITDEVSASFGTEQSASRPNTEEAGQGLGLSIVGKVMEAHDGEFVWPKNRAGQQGTEVSIKFPINS